VGHEQDGRAYVYKPTIARSDARRSALSHLVKTFFGGSAEQAVAALLDLEKSKLGKEELDRLGRLVDEAKREGR
jgi:predicted transcriptional regulator